MKYSFKKSDIFIYIIIAFVSYLSKQIVYQLFDSADEKKIGQEANEQKQEEQEEAKTQVISGTIQEHDYVDLGLSVKWATCNIGAENPWDYGDYFAWGETETKKSYTKENSTTYSVNYIELKSRDVVDDRGRLTLDYDAASANWGSEWRMPTDDEQRELLENCEHSWTKFNGVCGMKFTGKNGNFVFFPAAGGRFGSDVGGKGLYGRYWSSSRCEDGARGLYFDEEDVYWSIYYRSNGFSVRAVRVQK